jgi:Prp8 binding protein
MQAFEGPATKRPRTDDHVLTQGDSGGVRSSSLASPTLQLTGHAGSVYALQYSPSGETLCSASFDMKCLLWSHADYTNYNVLEGHRNAVLDCQWCDEDCVVTCGADRTVQLFDALTGKRLRKWQEHAAVVNACSTAVGVAGCQETNTVVTASDDASCLIWDRRQKSSVGSLLTDYPVIATACTSDQIFTAGIDNMITCWDVRKQRKVYGMKGHEDTVTCLAVHPEGTQLLSNSMDHTLRMWDIRHFVSSKKNRHSKTFAGHKHNAEKGLLKCSWSGDGNMVTAGSADKRVHIWDVFSSEELYDLPGHKGCVNCVTFHPTENVIASGASDKLIFVGELS